jgi:glutamine synthetase
VLICNICDPITGQDYPKDPRNIARKAEAFLKSKGIADTAFFGPEAEFFIFDDVRFDQNEHSGFYYIDSVEGRWNAGREEHPNLGYKVRYKEGYFPVPPTDSLQDIRSEMMLTMIASGIPIETQHHEVATGGQCEIDMRFAPMVEMADKLLKYKYIVKNTAKKYGRTATFMPKPLFGDNGSGMHVHMSFWKENKNLFAGDRYAGLSETALFAIGGLLNTHRPYSLLQTRRRTAISVSFLASRLRSTWPIPAETEVQPYVCRCTASRKRRSASSSADPMEARTPTSPLRRWQWQPPTGSRTR